MWVRLAIAFISIAAPFEIVAAQSECFCLQNTATLTIVRRGCEAYQIPNRVSENVTCQTLDYTEIESIEDHGKFERVPGGEGECNPCLASPSKTSDDGVREPMK